MAACTRIARMLPVHTYVPRKRRPVEDYPTGQGRYRHLFEPERNEEALRRIQEHVDRYSESME